MKYNSKHDRWVSKEGLIYRELNKKLVLCSQTLVKGGYLQVRTKYGRCYVHRLVWETFNGEIPSGYQIDHIKTIRTDNRLSQLKLVTPKENSLNKYTRQNKSNVSIKTEFGRKFKEHYNIYKSDNNKLYCKEYHYYKKHHKFSWE